MGHRGHKSHEEMSRLAGEMPCLYAKAGLGQLLGANWGFRAIILLLLMVKRTATGLRRAIGEAAKREPCVRRPKGPVQSCGERQ